MGRKSRSRRTRTARNTDAEEAISHLSEVLKFGLSEDSTIADNAARQLIGIGKKHGIRADPRTRGMICRTCKKSMLPGRTSRVRVSARVIITTCLRCSRIHRETCNVEGQ